MIFQVFITINPYSYESQTFPTHTAVNKHTHTHREHTPGAVGSHLCCSARGAFGGSVLCSRAPHRGIKGGESAGHSLPPPTIPARPRLEPATFGLQVWLSNHQATTSPVITPVIDLLPNLGLEQWREGCFFWVLISKIKNVSTKSIIALKCLIFNHSIRFPTLWGHFIFKYLNFWLLYCKL